MPEGKTLRHLFGSAVATLLAQVQVDSGRWTETRKDIDGADDTGPVSAPMCLLPVPISCSLSLPVPPPVLICQCQDFSLEGACAQLWTLVVYGGGPAVWNGWSHFVMVIKQNALLKHTFWWLRGQIGLDNKVETAWCTSQSCAC